MATSNPTLRSFLNGKHSMKTVFNFVYNKVIEQGRPSLIKGTCAFRSDNGKCAVGHLVPDREMNALMKKDSKMNHFGIDAIVYELNINHINYNGSNHIDYNSSKLDFIRDLQQAHDSAAFNDDNNIARYEVFVKQYKKKMADLAEKYGIEV